MIPPDAEERKKALDPAFSFIVEAPAGSGKTSLLVQRYLALLSRVDRPEAVVAMTFTRKAAKEMLDRVLDALRKRYEDATANEYDCQTAELVRAVLRQDKQKGWNLLQDPSRLQIQTIDSLCSMLTRRMPVLSHLGGAPRVRETPDELYRLAARQTISALAEGNEQEQGVFRRVALHFDNNLAMLETQIAKMLSKREQWSEVAGQLQEAGVQDFCGLLNYAERFLQQVFREAGEVDFTEITRAAIAALGGEECPSDLLYWLDYRIQHLLVDEFQDTSLSQYRLIEALTGQWSDGDGRTLFLVGDPMQSIYRFRQAEVAFFLQCRDKQRLGAVRLERARLTANFRSTREIVDWAQERFATILGFDDLAQGNVGLRPASAMRTDTGAVPEVIPFVDDGRSAQAQKVVELTRRSMKQGDVAILVRGRSHLLEILPKLRDAGIRYEAIDIDQLCEEQHILDLISITRAILHVGDRLSWLACLRAPWCGLNLTELTTIAEGDPNSIILERISLVPRATRIGEVLREAVEAVGRLPLRDLVERTWLALGGPAALREANHRVDVETYLDLLGEFEQGGTVRDFSLLDERMRYLFAKPAAGADRVKVMTIHGAKGLEFDTVIVPEMGRGASSSDRDLLIWSERIGEDGQPRLKLAVQPKKKDADPAYKEIKDELDTKERNELKRLFYVAVTRAKNQLFLLGSVKSKEGKTKVSDPPSGTFLRLLWTDVKPAFESELRRNQQRHQQLSLLTSGTERFNLVRHLPDTWRLPRFDHSVQWQPELRRAVASASKVDYEWVSGTGRHIGTVIHDALRRMTTERIWSQEEIGSRKGFFGDELKRLGVGADEIAEASGRVVRALANTVRSERGRWVLGAHEDSRAEWPLGGVVGDHLISGIVDRTFRDADGRRWIVDYKTSEHEGADIEEFLARQYEQYRRQLENYAVLVSRLTQDPIRLGLYFPMLDAWREWPFAEEVGAPAAPGALYTGS